MNDDDLRHVLHRSAAVHFVLDHAFTKTAFVELLRVFSERSAPDTSATPDSHWSALAERMRGCSRWDAITGRFTGSLDGVDNTRQYVDTLQTVDNIVRRRPYVAHTIDGVRYVIDVFNPANELELPYPHAGEPVVTLLISSKTRGLIRDSLASIESFYEILHACDRALHPSHVCGTYSMAAVAFAYREGRVDPTVGPWSFLHPLTVLPRESLPQAGHLHMLFARFDNWSRDRMLLQVMPGLNPTLWPNYVTAAQALGMTSVSELVE